MKERPSMECVELPNTNNDIEGSGPLKVLYAGGCHVGGFPIGEELGFSYIATECLRAKFPSRSVEAKTQLYVNLATADRIVEACREYEPHVLVLQVGHYESLIPLKKRILKLVRRKGGGPTGPKKDVVRWSSDYEPQPELYFSETWIRKVKSAGKLILDLLLRVGGRPGFDRSLLQSRLAELLRGAQGAGVPHVVLLSPFPCIDAMVGNYRRQEHSIFVAEAKKAGCQFVDVTAIVQRDMSPAKKRRLYADDRHLGVEGHRATGLLVAENIAEALQRIPEPELAAV